MEVKEVGAAIALLKEKAIEKVPDAVEEWLDDHPEATTTVEDGAITKAKLTSTLAEEIEGNTEDVTQLKNALTATTDVYQNSQSVNLSGYTPRKIGNNWDYVDVVNPMLEDGYYYNNPINDGTDSDIIAYTSYITFLDSNQSPIEITKGGTTQTSVKMDRNTDVLQVDGLNITVHVYLDYQKFVNKQKYTTTEYVLASAPSYIKYGYLFAAKTEEKAICGLTKDEWFTEYKAFGGVEYKLSEQLSETVEKVSQHDEEITGLIQKTSDISYSGVDRGVAFASDIYKASDGTTTSGGAHTISNIPTDVVSVSADGTNVTQIELVAWNDDGEYVGIWNPQNKSFAKEDSYGTFIDISDIALSFPTYSFKLNAKHNNSITSSVVSNYLTWVHSRITEFISVKDVIAFDNSTIIVIPDCKINGANGGSSYDSNYVSTDYIDISNRIGNKIQFNSTVLVTTIGFAIYDKGFNRIDGMWGNSSDRESHGIADSYTPQTINWDLSPEAHYIRLTMTKDRYTQPSDFNVKFYQYKQYKNADVDTNFITIAHKGYGIAEQNSLKAFISAAEIGFKAVEIDCRRTTDGVYVVSHNDTNTLYRNGTSQSATISTSAWSDLKGMTIDSAGKYPLCTLAQVFDSLKRYKVQYYIIDLKTGTNAEIMKLARRCGVVSQIMLSYYSQQPFLDDLEMLADYPQIAIRFTPLLTPEAYATVKTSIKNQLFADVNLSDGGSTYFPKALSMQLPILFSGVQESNKYVMAGLGCGGMAQTTLQYSPYDFDNMIQLDFNQFPTLSTETQSVSISTGSNATVTVESDIDDPACWVYGYSDDLSVCDVTQSAYGNSVTFTVSKVGAGSANLIVFTPTGEQLIIPVTAT